MMQAGNKAARLKPSTRPPFPPLLASFSTLFESFSPIQSSSYPAFPTDKISTPSRPSFILQRIHFARPSSDENTPANPEWTINMVLRNKVPLSVAWLTEKLTGDVDLLVGLHVAMWIRCPGLVLLYYMNPYGHARVHGHCAQLMLDGQAVPLIELHGEIS